MQAHIIVNRLNAIAHNPALDEKRKLEWIREVLAEYERASGSPYDEMDGYGNTAEDDMLATAKTAAPDLEQLRQNVISAARRELNAEDEYELDVLHEDLHRCLLALEKADGLAKRHSLSAHEQARQRVIHAAWLENQAGSDHEFGERQNDLAESIRALDAIEASLS